MDNETNNAVDPIVETEVEQSSSSIFNVSVRAWLALITTLTVCGMCICEIEVQEPLYSLSVGSCSFYFGQKGKR